MTFLELCQAVGTDSGLISYQNRPGTVAGALGKWADIVSFTAQALRDVQRARQDWEFMRGEFSAPLVIGKPDYTAAEVGITTRFARFANDVPADNLRPMRLFDATIGEADNQNLLEISPECWSMFYGRSIQESQRPREYALANSKLYVGPLPDKTYTIKGAYWKAPQTLALDGDVPDLPEHFHEIVKWKAILKISGKDGAFTDRIVAQAEYSTMFRQLVKEQLRRVSMGAPLA